MRMGVQRKKDVFKQSHHFNGDGNNAKYSTLFIRKCVSLYRPGVRRSGHLEQKCRTKDASNFFNVGNALKSVLRLPGANYFNYQSQFRNDGDYI